MKQVIELLPGNPFPLCAQLISDINIKPNHFLGSSGSPKNSFVPIVGFCWRRKFTEIHFSWPGFLLMWWFYPSAAALNVCLDGLDDIVWQVWDAREEYVPRSLRRLCMSSACEAMSYLEVFKYMVVV